MNKKIITIIAVAVVVGGGAFYGGMKYAQNNSLTDESQGISRGNFQNMRDLSPEERQQRFQELGAPLRQGFEGQANAGAGFRGGAGGGQRGGGGFTAGEIIAKDDKSVTVKLQDGGSKIVFVSDSTEITKSVDGTLVDLEVGKNINVNGAANSDGSVTAQSIQLRPQNNTQSQSN